VGIANKIKNSLIYIFGMIYNSRNSKCIFYHDIHSDSCFTNMSTSSDLFEKHISIIRKSGFEIVSEITKEKEQISISFDDGFKGFYENIEVINRLKIPITIFVVSSYLGEENFITKAQLKELHNNPLVTIQSHTHTHPDLTLLSSEKLEEELRKSKQILDEICDVEINSICFPKGLFSKRVVEISTKIGYTTQYSSLPGNYYNEVFPTVKRRSLVQFSSEKEFCSILKGGDHFLNYWYTKKYFSR